MSEPNVGVGGHDAVGALHWLPNGTSDWLELGPGMERMGRHWAGWADSSSAPASPVHLSPPHSHQGTSHSCVSIYSAQFGRFRVAALAVIRHEKGTAVTHIKIPNICFFKTLFKTHDLHSDVSEITSAALCLLFSLNVRWQQLIFWTSPIFFWLNTNTVLAFLLVVRKLRFGRTCWLQYLQLLHFGQNGVQHIPSENSSNHLLCKLMSPWADFCVRCTHNASCLCEKLIKT